MRRFYGSFSQHRVIALSGLVAGPSSLSWFGHQCTFMCSVDRCIEDNMQNDILEAIGTKRIGKCAGLWSLDHIDEASTQEVMEDAIQHSENYVLKPQREGGGNNLYGQQLKDRLGRREGLSAYILMQRIRPPIHQYITAFLSCC